MEYFFLIAAFNAFFFAVLILQKKKAIHDRILIAWLVYLGIYVGTYALFSDVLFTGYQLLSASFVSLLLLHGPFLYLYICALTNDKFRISAQRIIHFIPFLLFNLYLIIASFFPDISERIRLDHSDHSHGTTVLFNAFLILTVLSGPVYFILSIRLFSRLDINIFNNFSTSEHINLDWLRKLVYSFGLIWTVLMIVTAIHHVFNLFSWSFCTDGLTLSLSFFIILIGYFGLRQKEIFVHHLDKNVEYFIEPKTKYANILLKEAEADEYIDKLKQFMETHRPYLNADLTLPQLASDLEIPSHHLSRVINEKLNLNFFDFINQYRVEEVKSKINDVKFNHLSILGIAF
ncbi:MAG: AraC family transcriptional regulator, partial [Bacteroidia bacterium]|nr:AraC family transcriptional regulator [Bacteroidia bacterium]